MSAAKPTRESRYLGAMLGLAVPERWREVIAMREVIEDYAHRLSSCASEASVRI